MQTELHRNLAMTLFYYMTCVETDKEILRSNKISKSMFYYLLKGELPKKQSSVDELLKSFNLKPLNIDNPEEISSYIDYLNDYKQRKIDRFKEVKLMSPDEIDLQDEVKRFLKDIKNHQY